MIIDALELLVEAGVEAGDVAVDLIEATEAAEAADVAVNAFAAVAGDLAEKALERESDAEAATWVSELAAPWPRGKTLSQGVANLVGGGLVVVGDLATEALAAGWSAAGGLRERHLRPAGQQHAAPLDAGDTQDR